MQNRRSFLKTASVASAAGSFLNLNPSAMGANEKVVLGVIGTRAQGRYDAMSAIKAGAVIKTVCDIDDAVITKVSAEYEKAQGKAPGSVKDFRKVLDDKEIDAVIIGTPDHWHAIPTIMACQAGKDVYIEKPLSQTIQEGQLMRDAARKYNRVVQVGTQRRSGEHFRTAVEYVGSGKLGKICMVKAWMCQVRGSIGNPPDSDPPVGVDSTGGLGPRRSGRSTRTGFTITGGSSWITATPSWATRASTCSTSRCGASRSCAGSRTASPNTSPAVRAFIG